MTYAKKDYLTSVNLAFNGMPDSCLSAILLKKQKYQINGIYFSIEKDQFSYLEEEFRRYFCLDISKVQSKADEIGITVSIIDVTEEFRALVLEPFIASLIDLETSSIEVEIHHFLLNMMSIYSKERTLAFGYYCKVLKQDKKYGVYAHSNLSLDQSHLIRTDFFKEDVLFPLGDLGKNEKLNLIKQFELKPIELLSYEKESNYHEIVPIDLIRDFDYDGHRYNAFSFKAKENKSFILKEYRLRYIESTLFTIKLENVSHIDRSIPLSLFIKHMNELVKVKVYFKTLNRIVLESPMILGLKLGETLILYRGDLKNSKVFTHAKVIDIKESNENHDNITISN